MAELDKLGNPIQEYINVPEQYRQGFADYMKDKGPVMGGAAITPVQLPDGSTIQFGDTGTAARFKEYLNTTGQTNQQTTQTLTDPSQYVQAQVGAAVTQPTLPTGTAVTPGLALQQVTPSTLQTTPGLEGQVQAPTPTPTVAPTIPTAEVPSAAQIQQAQVTSAPQYQAVTAKLYLKW